jgi:hypothetical protein
MAVSVGLNHLEVPLRPISWFSGGRGGLVGWWGIMLKGFMDWCCWKGSLYYQG